MPIAGDSKNTFWFRLLVDNTSSILPTSFTCFNCVNFINLNFIELFNEFVTYDENTGIFLFKKAGMIAINGCFNFEAGTNKSSVELIIEIDKGSGWEKLLSRSNTIPSNENMQMCVLSNQFIEKETKLRLFFRTALGTIKFKTQTITDGAMSDKIYACVLDISLTKKFDVRD